MVGSEYMESIGVTVSGWQNGSRRNSKARDSFVFSVTSCLSVAWSPANFIIGVASAL